MGTQILYLEDSTHQVDTRVDFQAFIKLDPSQIQECFRTGWRPGVKQLMARILRRLQPPQDLALTAAHDFVPNNLLILKVKFNPTFLLLFLPGSWTSNLLPGSLISAN